jgi:hypothetical protein
MSVGCAGHRVRAVATYQGFFEVDGTQDAAGDGLHHVGLDELLVCFAVAHGEMAEEDDGFVEGYIAVRAAVDVFDELEAITVVALLHGFLRRGIHAALGDWELLLRHLGRTQRSVSAARARVGDEAAVNHGEGKAKG